jgi:hypothetical protein
MALSLFLSHSQPGDTLHSLTDSAHAALAITKHHKPRTNRALVYAVRRLYYRALMERHVLIEWVPAHVSIDGNEQADGLADEGARQSGLGRYLRPLQQLERIATGTFTGASARTTPPPRARPPQPAKRRRPAGAPPSPRKRACTQQTLLTTATHPTSKRPRPRVPDPPAVKRVRYNQTSLSFAQADRG